MKTNTKHGIEIRFGKGRSLKVLSYAIFDNGNCLVSHETTNANRLAGCSLENLMKIESDRYPNLLFK